MRVVEVVVVVQEEPIEQIQNSKWCWKRQEKKNWSINALPHSHNLFMTTLNCHLIRYSWDSIRVETLTGKNYACSAIDERHWIDVFLWTLTRLLRTCTSKVIISDETQPNLLPFLDLWRIRLCRSLHCWQMRVCAWLRFRMSLVVNGTNHRIA